MKKRRIISISLAATVGIALLVVLTLALLVTPVASQEPDEAAKEAEKTAAAEQQVSVPERDGKTYRGESLSSHPLFVGLDDATVPAFRVDPATSDAFQVFNGYEVWGAAYDYMNDQVYFSSGTELLVWPVGGSVTSLGIVSDTTGSNTSMEGLGFYDGLLYASKVSSTGEGEGIYLVDPNTLVSTRVITYADPAAATISGIDIDPDTGILYGTNDATALRGLVQIDPDGTVTVVAPYLGGETDVDGLAVGGGHAYLITDDQTPPEWDVFDLTVLTYTGFVTSPFTTTEVFAGGAWIQTVADSVECNGPAVTFDEGLPTTWITATTTGPVYWALSGDVNACDNPYEAGGTEPGACADADTTNGAGDPYDTEMWTNAFSLVGQQQASLDLQWRHRQLNNSVFNVDVSIDGGLNWTNIFTDASGNPGGSAGDFASLDLGAFLEEPSVMARFRYYGDAWDWYAQVDDVSVSCQAPGQPGIEIAKTVGTDPSVCAASDEIYVPAGSDVYYCYEVTNTGTLTLTMHDLVDSELGQLLTGFPFDLTPGSSAYLTASATINATTVNTATWTAYNPGPVDQVTAMDTATVNVVQSAAFPYCEGFEGGTLPGAFYPITTSSGAANGRVQVTTAYPNTGLYNLDIDTDCDGCGGSTLQSATMVIDLAGETNVELNFWVYEHGDENNPEDGVFISDDGGGTWAQIVDLNNFPANYENVILDLAAAAAGAGMNLVDGFQIRFQSYDNFMIPTDGYSFDDICVQPDLPEIDFEKTVGLDPNACATSDAIDVPAGTDVTYCYKVTNTGNFTLTRHDLDDSEIGSILSNFQYDLTPGLTVWLTASATINATTVNTATWTAYNPGMVDVAVDTDSATVNVTSAPLIDVDPTSLNSQQGFDVQVTLPLTISNIGDADLTWELFEEAPAPIPAAGVPSSHVPRAPEVVTSEEECAAYENYAGSEPLGYAEICMGIKPEQHVADGMPSFDPTDTAFALDIGFVSDNFVSHVLNDFPGQTVLGPNAQPIFAMDFDETATTLYAIDNTSRELGTLDLANGTFNSIAVVSGIPAADNISGLTIDPSNGTAYVSGLGAAMTLYTMDLATGVATPIGSDPVVTLLIDIAIGPQGVIYGHDIGTDNIYTIDKNTGAATVVGPTGVNSNFAQGMDFDNIDGTLYAYTYQGGGANVYGTIDLATGTLTPLATSNPQGEFEGATQTASVGCGPSDIPWLSAAPTSGTIAAAGSQVVDVTFDSTGLAAGTYTGTLCIESNDFFNPVVRVPVTMLVEWPAITLDKTVGEDAASCATTDSITVPAGGGGTTVYYCYEVTNTGDVTLTTHSLVDSEFGAILTDFAYDLGPGASVNTVQAGLVISANITATTVNTATWTAMDATGASASATDSATVTVSPPTDVSLSSFGDATPVAMMPIWMAIGILALMAGAAYLWRRRILHQ